MDFSVAPWGGGGCLEANATVAAAGSGKLDDIRLKKSIGGWFNSSAPGMNRQGVMQPGYNVGAFSAVCCPGLQNLGAELEKVPTPEKETSSYFRLKWGVHMPWLSHENQTPRSDLVNFVVSTLIFRPQILEPRLLSLVPSESREGHWTHREGVHQGVVIVPADPPLARAVLGVGAVSDGISRRPRDEVGASPVACDETDRHITRRRQALGDLLAEEPLQRTTGSSSGPVRASRDRAQGSARWERDEDETMGEREFQELTHIAEKSPPCQFGETRGGIET